MSHSGWKKTAITQSRRASGQTSDIVESFNGIQTVGKEVEVTYTTCTVTESPWDQPPSPILLEPIIECRRQFTISKTEVTVVVVDNEGLSTSPSPGYARE